MPARRRILIAVEPAILGDVLAHVLVDKGDDVVVIDLREPVPLPAQGYDVAVVTDAMIRDGLVAICAGLVIQLPDTEGGGGAGLVTSRSGTEAVELNGLDDLLRVLGS